MNCFCLLLISNLFIFGAVQSGPMNSPDDPLEQGRPIVTPPDSDSGRPVSPAIFLYRGYQLLMSPARGGRCPMYPSCSSYSHKCIERKGIVSGLIDTTDRLIRCGKDLQYYELILTPRGVSFNDPPH